MAEKGLHLGEVGGLLAQKVVTIILQQVVFLSFEKVV
jgi:hypothetical protein